MTTVLLLCAASTASVQKRGWSDPEPVLLSDPKTRMRAIRDLRLPPGVWTLAAVTMTSGGDSARLLETIAQDARAVILIEAPESDVVSWKNEWARRPRKAGWKLRAQVRAVPPAVLGDIGIFYYPTSIKVTNTGKVLGARRG